MCRDDVLVEVAGVDVRRAPVGEIGEGLLVWVWGSELACVGHQQESGGMNPKSHAGKLILGPARSTVKMVFERYGKDESGRVMCPRTEILDPTRFNVEPRPLSRDRYRERQAREGSQRYTPNPQQTTPSPRP